MCACKFVLRLIFIFTLLAFISKVILHWTGSESLVKKCTCELADIFFHVSKYLHKHTLLSKVILIKIYVEE